MSTQFDPYYSWLGIPPAEQPPNHYRLLGITLFEPNEDVIQNGLDQRMMHLRSFSGGPRGREAERLITEVSQAGVCLLRRDRRQAYDTQLKTSLQAEVERATARPPAIPPPAMAVPPVSPHPNQPVQQISPPNPMPPQLGPARRSIVAERRARRGFPIVPTILGTGIGLSIACLAWILLSPGDASFDKIVQLTAPEQDAEGSDETGESQGVGDTSATGDGKSGDEAPPEEPSSKPGVEAHTTEPIPAAEADRTSPMVSDSPPADTAKAGNPPSWPRALPGSPPPNPLNSPATSSNPVEMDEEPTRSLEDLLQTDSEVKGTTKSVVLDLESSSMRVSLAENVEDKEVLAKVQELTDLTTPYTLQPFDGIVSLDQPVDILLSEYAGVKFRLSMHRRGKEVELEVAPEIETGDGETSDFSKRKLDNLKRAIIKSGNALGKQLTAAQSEALALQNAMKSPAAAPVRKAQKQRHKVLTAQIPVLQNQLSYVQARGNVVQQLSLLTKRIHEKTTLNLVVQVKSAEEAQ